MLETQTPDVPVCFRRAREEMLLALDAPSAEEEHLHRLHASALIAIAIRSMHRQPERIHDWKHLNPGRNPGGRSGKPVGQSDNRH